MKPILTFVIAWIERSHLPELSAPPPPQEIIHNAQ